MLHPRPSTESYALDFYGIYRNSFFLKKKKKINGSQNLK